MTEFMVKEGNVLQEPSDLLLLKYAQNFYGADRAVASRLESANVCSETEIRPRINESVLIETEGAMAPTRVMFIGTISLGNFSYDEMENFTFFAIKEIANLDFSVRNITTTVHGTGYGLDGGESLERLVQGFQAGLELHNDLEIERITFLTLDEREARMLSKALEGVKTSASSISEKSETAISKSEHKTTTKKPVTTVASIDSPVSPAVSKRRIFVALPFTDDFENVYEFAIYPAVRKCGFICERVDKVHFTGDVLSRIREGIEVAELVIADLTEGRPNVYLEVGYAWGKDVPVVFIAKKGEKIHFDVRSHKCIYYGRFKHLEKDLEELILGILAPQAL